MSDINFLDNKKNNQDQKSKEQKEELAWSKPQKEIKNPKKSPFSFFSSLNKKSVDKDSKPEINKNKIKQSRAEILNLIKRHEYSQPPIKNNNKSFLSNLSHKFKGQPAPKDILIDYQKIFNQEKEHKKNIGQFYSEPEVDNKPMVKTKQKPAKNWFNFKNFFINKQKVSPSIEEAKIEKVELSEVKEANPPVVLEKEKVAKQEEKQTEINKEEEIKKKEEWDNSQYEQIRQQVLETNLIKGEIITFFDWHSKIGIVASAFLIPIFVIGASYYGLALYQKSNEAKNAEQMQKFLEVEQEIAKEEVDLKEISDFQAKLKVISKVFSQHIYWTNFFKFLEDNTIKDVYFVNFEGDTSGNYKLDSLATKYSSIPEQINTFKNNKKINNVLAEGGEMVAGNEKNKTLVKFILNFSVSKDIFTE